MKRRGGEGEGGRPRAQKHRRVQQSRSCESLPPPNPTLVSHTTRAGSCGELDLGRSNCGTQAVHQPSLAEVSEGERACTKEEAVDVVDPPAQCPLPEVEGERVVEDMHRCFGARKKVLLSGLPSSCSERRLSGFLEEYSCTVVSKPRDNSVRLLFTDPQKARVGIALLNTAKFEGHKLSAAYGHPDSLLFIGNLPYMYTSDDLLDLFRTHGDILRCFVVCSTLTGLSKGYGFVEFSRKEEALVAKQEMANKVVGPRNLRVDFADNGMQTCPDLQSRTLFVDRLPKGFRNDGKLRELFGKHGTVNFCQVAVTGSGLSRGFAFVDMSTSQEAEKAQSLCNGISFLGQEIRVSFGMPCRPGACILQHKTSGPLAYNTAGRAAVVQPKENQLFVPPTSNNPLLAKAPSTAVYLPHISLYAPHPPLMERANGSHCLIIPSSFSFPMSSREPPTVSLPSQCPPAPHATTEPQGHPTSQPREPVDIDKPSVPRAQKRPAPDSIEDLSSGLVGVYDRPYIGQHQQGIPYTHPLKRIKMEDTA